MTIARLRERGSRQREEKLPIMPEKTRTFSTSIDLSHKTRDSMIALCNQQLADTFDLYSQIKQAHWNIKGEQFIALHKLYDEFAEQIIGYVDEIAERASALGGVATGTVRMAASNSRLPDYPLDATKDMDTVKELVERYAAYAKSTRKAIDEAEEMMDATTADLFTEISRETDKSLWFLEAHLQQ
jgi:starvation-inducible DNA-binding protein